MAFGIDISEHQRGFNDFAPYAFAILRARNENGVNDSRFWEHWRAAEGRTKRGVYGWPIAGAGVEDNYIAGQRLVKDFPGSEFGYWADREHSGRGTASVEEVEAYCRGIQDAGGAAGFYSNIGELPRSPYLDTLPWWMADYGPNNGQQHDPNEQAPRPPGDRPWAIHQFTSLGGPNGSGLDVNVTNDTFTPVQEDDTMQLADFAAIFDGTAERIAGKNLDGTYTTNRQVIDQAMALNEKADALIAKVDALIEAQEAPGDQPPPANDDHAIPPPSIDQVLAHAAECRTWRQARKSIQADLAKRA